MLSDTNMNQIKPHKMWASREMKEQVAGGCVESINDIEWLFFITLTFKEENISIEWAEKKFKRLIQLLNKKAFGNHYTRKVKHCHFSYAYVLEKQQRGTYHFHVLVDRPIDFDYLNSIWSNSSGICEYGDVKDCLRAEEYLCKNAIDGTYIYYRAIAQYPSIPVQG